MAAAVAEVLYLVSLSNRCSILCSWVCLSLRVNLFLRYGRSSCTNAPMDLIWAISLLRRRSVQIVDDRGAVAAICGKRSSNGR